MKKYFLTPVLCLLFSGLLPAQNYTWTPDGTGAGTVGGSGTWNNTLPAWWNGSTAVAGSPLGATASGTFFFNGSGVITKTDTTDFATTGGASGTTMLKFTGGNYTFLGGAGGTPARIQTGQSILNINVAASSTVTFGGDGNYLGVIGGLNGVSNDGLTFSGGGQINFGSGAVLAFSATQNSRMALRDGTKVVFGEGSTFARVTGAGQTPAPTDYVGAFLYYGHLEVNGGNLYIGYNITQQGGSRGFGMTIGAADDIGELSTFTLNSGTVTAIGNPANPTDAGSGGVVFGGANNQAGGILNLNGGTFIVSNFKVRSGVNTAIINFDGVTLMPCIDERDPIYFRGTGGAAAPTDAQLQVMLDGFLPGGSGGLGNTATRYAELKAGGLTVDTSLIDRARTNGTVTIAAIMRGVGGVAVTGSNTLRFSGTHLYTGTTNVRQGMLVLDAVNALQFSEDIVVAAGATLKSSNTLGTTFRAQKYNNLAGSGTVIMGNAALNLNNTALSAFNGKIDTTAAITKTGTGTLHLSEIPNVTININEGALRADASYLAGIIAARTNITNKGAFDFYQAAGTQTISVPSFAGTGSIVKSGAGTLAFNAIPAGLPSITIAEGTLIGNDIVIPTSIVNNAILEFNPGGGVTQTVVNHRISGTGVIRKTGAGTLELETAPSTITSIDVLSGTLRTNAGGLATAINNTSHLVFHQAADTTSTRTHIVTGAGSLTKTGAGTVKLAANTVAGGLLLEEGRLLLANGATLTTPSFLAGENTIIGGYGSIIGSGTVRHATVRAGDFDNTSAPTALTVNGNLAFENATLEFLLLNNGTQSTQFNYTGAALDPTKVTINIIGAYSGTYNLGNIGALETAVLTANGQAANARQGGIIDNVGGALILYANNDYSRYVTWTNAAATGHWNVVDGNWSTSGAFNTYAPGDSAIINNTAAPATITLDSDVILSGLEVKTDRDLTLTGAVITTNTSFAPGEITNPTGKLVKKGAATLTLNSSGANSFTQGVDIAEGTLAFTHGNQLMSDSAAGITFTGSGTLRPAADNLAITSNITIPAGITASIDTAASGTLTHAGKLNTAANSTLSKTGAGVLVIETTNDVSTHLGTTSVQQGTLALYAAFSSTATWKSQVTGAGAFEKNGLGVLILAAPLANAGPANISAGTLRLAAANLLNAASPHTIASGAMLDLDGHSQTIASLANNGTLYMTARINNTLGYIVEAQTLTVTGNASGAGNILVTMTNALASETEGDPRRTIVSVAGDNTANFTLALDRRYAAGDFDWQLVREGNSYVLGREIPPEIPTLGGIDTALILGSNAAYNALSQHNAATQLSNIPEERRHSSTLWLNTTWQNDKIENSLYKGADATTTLVQVGFDNHDYRYEPVTFGVAIDCAQTDFDMPARAVPSTNKTILYGVDAYLLVHPGSWYLSALLRASKATTQVQALDAPRFDVNSRGYGGTLEAGYNWKTKNLWLVQPQVQWLYQTFKTDGLVDVFSRRYTIGTTDMNNLRAGVLVAKTFVMGSNRTFSPYIRASYINEFSGDTAISANASYTGPSTYCNDLGGSYALVNGGFVWGLGDRFSLSADASTQQGDAIKRYAINLGAALRW